MATSSPCFYAESIDRVDFDAGGIKAIIMDYKLGKPPDYAALANGSSLQMPLYLLAMERLFGKVGAAACYDSAQETGRRRIYRTEHVNMKQFAPLPSCDASEHVKPHTRQQFSDLLQTAETAAIGAARAIEAGRIEARPGDHCAACDYKDVCRTSRAQGHDGETPALLTAAHPLTAKTPPQPLIRNTRRTEAPISSVLLCNLSRIPCVLWRRGL